MLLYFFILYSPSIPQIQHSYPHPEKYMIIVLHHCIDFFCYFNSLMYEPSPGQSFLPLPFTSCYDTQYCNTCDYGITYRSMQHVNDYKSAQLINSQPCSTGAKNPPFPNQRPWCVGSDYGRKQAEGESAFQQVKVMKSLIPDLVISRLSLFVLRG